MLSLEAFFFFRWFETPSSKGSKASSSHEDDDENQNERIFPAKEQKQNQNCVLYKNEKELKIIKHEKNFKKKN